MWTTFGLQLAVLATIFSTALSLRCYRCHSTQPGCGKELNIRLQRLESCPAEGLQGGENHCVKVIEYKDGEEHLTRECLTTLMKQTLHRKSLPTVRRHGYCELARNDDPTHPLDEHKTYCFCNDWSGCNGAGALTGRWGLAALAGALAVAAARLL